MYSSRGSQRNGTMIDLLAGVDSSAMFGLQWPTWIKVGGVALLCLAVLYLITILMDADRLWPQFHRLQPRTIRGRLFAGISLAAAVPALCIALVLAERTANERINGTTQLLERQAERINENIEFSLRNVVGDLTSVADGAPADIATDPTRAEAWLVKQHGRNSRNVSDLLLVDPTASVVAMSRIVDNRPVPVLPGDDSLANRPYFYFPMTGPAHYISNAVTDPLINIRSRAVIGIPLRTDSARNSGVLIGAIGPQLFQSIEQRMMVDRGMGMMIIDRNGGSVFSSGTIGLSNHAVAAATGGVFGFTAATTAAGRPQRFLAAGFDLESGWRVYVYQPLVELETSLIWDYLTIAAGLAIAVLVSMQMARKLAADYSRPLLALDHAINEFDLNMSPKPTALTSNTPREIRSIFKHLEELDHRLREAYGKLRKSVHQGEKLRGELIYVIANREKEIKQRTVELKEANETLERLSREDSLTGLANRRWFAEFLARTWRRAIREKQPVSVLIIDIDNFKAYNDTYGHQKGDMCLKLVAEAIRRSVGRATDLVSRYGGEEFIVVLGDTPLDGALQIAEDIRATVEKLDIPHKGSELHPVVTVSIGATSTLPSSDMQPETFLVAADRAMYRAKNDGKNQVAYSTSSKTGVYQALCMPDGKEKRLS